MIYDNNEDVSMYLVKAFTDSLFLVNIKTPTKDFTIEQYKEWERKMTENAICINNIYPPQSFRNSDIKECISISDILGEVLDELKVNLEDIMVPFIGGIIGCDFRELLKILWDGENTSFWSCKAKIKNYYKEVVGKIKVGE